MRTARAKGASGKRVLWRHVMRNSLIPIATLLGLSVPGIMSGALITESVFNYPGMGYLFYQSALRASPPWQRSAGSAPRFLLLSFRRAGLPKMVDVWAHYGVPKHPP